MSQDFVNYLKSSVLKCECNDPKRNENESKLHSKHENQLFELIDFQHSNLKIRFVEIPFIQPNE